jgi:hypothetical protein
VRVGTGLPLRNVKRMTRLLCDKIETIDPGFGIEAGSAPTRHTRLDHGPGSRALPQGRGMEAKLAFLGHALMENRSCLILTPASRRSTARPSVRRRWR